MAPNSLSHPFPQGTAGYGGPATKKRKIEIELSATLDESCSQGRALRFAVLEADLKLKKVEAIRSARMEARSKVDKLSADLKFELEREVK